MIFKKIPLKDYSVTLVAAQSNYGEFCQLCSADKDIKITRNYYM